MIEQEHSPSVANGSAHGIKMAAPFAHEKKQRVPI